jgi:hypothetical protein
MNITELGKYRTRGGSEAEVTSLNGSGIYPIHYRIGDSTLTATRDGRWHANSSSDRDLVEKIDERREEFEDRLSECEKLIQQLTKPKLTVTGNPTSDGPWIHKMLNMYLKQEPEPKFEITEPGLYKTRDGQLVEVTTVECDIPNYPIAGTIENDWQSYMTWTIDGIYCITAGSGKSFDLVEKVKISAYPEWIDKAFDAPTPDDVDTIIKDAEIVVGSIDANESTFDDVYYTNCKIEVRNFTDAKALFWDCVFEHCTFICNDALIERGFSDCRLIGSVTFITDTDKLLIDRR